MPEDTRRQLAIWLGSVCVFIFLIVVVGGLTRLTRSGLSMVEWNPVTGIVPPTSEQEWQEAFDKYKQFPEYQQLNRGMSMDEFKFIYYWEFIHRVIGRLIGLVFFLPFVYFLVRKKLKMPEIKKFSFMFVLGGLQGLMGWYMVKSGLVREPAVSHYRLAAHLGLAFFLFSYIQWTILSFYYTDRPALDAGKRRVVGLAWLVTGLIVIQIVYGAFVAGLKAGYIYNTWPLMGESFAPANLSAGQGMLALFEGKAMVQFIHRLIAYLLVFAIGWLFWEFRKAGFSGRRQKFSFIAFKSMFLVQLILGIVTILFAVPIAIGTAHQAGALLLLAASLLLNHSLVSES